MPGTWVDLSVAARLRLRAMKRQWRGRHEVEPDLGVFERELTEAAARCGAVIAETAWIRLPAQEAPWRDTGMTLAPGESVSLFAAGRTYASRALDIWVSPKTQLWARLGEGGPIRSSSRDTNTLHAEAPGRLYVGNYFPNDWKDVAGARLQDDAVYRTVSGEMRILAIRWRGDPLDGLDALVAAGDPCGLASSERDRLLRGPPAPDGWRYLWHLGDAEIFRPCRDPSGADALCCETHRDVGILQRDVAFPLEPTTELAWRWRVDALPGGIREDSVPSHDYLSIAVEFANGLDLTYYWSAALPVGAHYWCPLPNWKHREYHVVVRSGKAGLGEWQRERRNLHDDALSYFGAHPGDVVRVWLIAVSIFQRGTGICTYADIRLSGGGQECTVL
jgi:Protein of unknown function (DUF3047)